MKVVLPTVLLLLQVNQSSGWVYSRPTSSFFVRSTSSQQRPRTAVFGSVEFESEDQKNEAVGNLIEDDEWMGVSMELSETIRIAVIEDIKTNARDFLGKDEYKVGDISKELDMRVKEEIAKMRGKDECKWIHMVN
jgi:hypothetical protein